MPACQDPVDGADTLLTVRTDTAMQIGLAKGTATSAAAWPQPGLNIVATLAGGGATSSSTSSATRPRRSC